MEDKDGKVNRSPGYRFEVRVQSLAPIRRKGSKAFQLNWVDMKKSDKGTCFSNWAKALGDQKTWKEEDPEILQEKELKGEGKHSKLYGVGASGMQISIQF